MEMYNVAQQEAIAAKMKVQEIDQWKPNEAMENEEAKIPEETALATVQMEKQNSNIAIEASQVAARLAGEEKNFR
ncbi:hypothetical protein LIER_40752 [Lithospermum erythrorhizon]|uniref:Uncharacterized protein n=1 Tax=Lithospermum erythrorhizon TaxID=34254 RepID=A0AAV3QZD9_LITER